LFSDLRKTAKLLSKLIEKATTTIVNEQDIFDDLELNYLSYDVTLKAKFNDEFHKNAYYRFRKSKAEKANEIFGEQIIRMDDFAYTHYLPIYFNETIDKQEFFKLMDKTDVENVIKQTIDKHGINFSIESDFIELIKLVDKSTWIAEWNFLNKI
jgi:hypothetical protein